ncbi:MAG TPA: hypothetical protein VG734_03170 [Lacunisphaera sp.]|nr:hypothetical protein [Lacunisphaera sp.]
MNLLKRPHLLVTFAVLLLGGCASVPKPSAYTISLTLDSPLVGTSVQVDLVGANELTDLPKWQAYSVTEYWQPGNPFRRDARKHTVQFSRDQPNTQMLVIGDSIWREWLNTGAMHLVIMADLPGAVMDQVGNADPRRLILPLDKSVWPPKTTTIQVLVQESGLRLLTPRKP